MKISDITIDDIVPVSLFGKDHWSTFAYAESVMMDYGCFQIGYDLKMRQNRRSRRVMREQCPKPIGRPSASNPSFDWDPKYSTRLFDDTVVDGHDDWDCIQDMTHAGFFVGETGNILEVADVGDKLSLSPTGEAAINALRAHKRGGSSFGTFRFVPPTMPAQPVPPQENQLLDDPKTLEILRTIHAIGAIIVVPNQQLRWAVIDTMRTRDASMIDDVQVVSISSQDLVRQLEGATKPIVLHPSFTAFGGEGPAAKATVDMVIALATPHNEQFPEDQLPAFSGPRSPRMKETANG